MAGGYGKNPRLDKRSPAAARRASQSAPMPEPTSSGTLVRKLLILVLPLAALGCAVVAEPQSNVAGTTCWKELPTGSNLPVTRCMTEEDRKRQKEAVDAAGAEIQRAVPNKTGRSGT